tara:strand:+ start:86 stop:1003 length:918 start_codon:yes stop_codon:yes gene_type:complete
MKPTIENAIKQQEYIDSLKQQFGEMTPVEKSLRERSVDALTPVIGALPFGSGGDFRDRKIAKNLLGDYYADSIADSVGVADFTPAGLVFGVDEALREYKQAEKPTDFILPTVGLGLSAVEAYPVTKVITKPLRTFLSNLSNKTSVPTDVGRRTFIQGAVAAPVVAGALSQIPLSKIAKDVKPVVEKVKFNLDLSSLESFQDKVEEFFDSAFLEGDMVRADMIEKTSDKDLFFGGLEQEIAGKEDFKGSFFEKMINEIKDKNPKVTDQQIFDEFSDLFEGGDDYFSDIIPETALNYKIKPIEKELQ